MSWPRFPKLAIAASLFLLLALVVLGALATRGTRTLGLNETLQFDDFFFTVESITPLNAVSGPPGKVADAPARDANQVLRVRIENRAKRVPFTVNGQSLAFVDPSGRLPAALPQAERSPKGDIIAPVTHVLQAGETIVIDYVFALPPDRSDLRLRIMPGGPVGDMLEALFFGRQEYRLP
jgi:hypothetical protein